MAEGTAQQAIAVSEVKVRTTCRSCEAGGLVRVLDLGNLYVSNFTDSPAPERWPRVPLELLLCSKCSLLQLRHTTPPEWLYRRYWYKSGVNASMRAALGDIARQASGFVNLRSGDNVLDIGCNDGTLLRSYSVPGIRRIGFEPAGNLAGEASDGTDRIIPNFFSSQPVSGEKFRIITSIAMFYDLEDPNAFVADLASVLAEDGVWAIEMHYLPLTLASNAFDAICHEHLEYYSLASLEPLLARHGLTVADVETNEVNGGSLRALIVHSGSPRTRIVARHSRVQALRAQEQLLALGSPETYEELSESIQRIGNLLGSWLRWERARGREISAYGASTKGNTLLQVFGFDHNLIRSAAERSSEKWGKYTVGTWIPIVPEAEAREHAEDFLVLPWHFLAEMRERERDFLSRGGKLIAPLPEPRIIDSTGVHPIA
ncbi:MAG TPA: methyltransferase domain-containing protein [Candidatus Acidoferrales bacterium]|nr:methyltransferase domain-containing protein [Candidatus Acidoferrales bacterium]